MSSFRALVLATLAAAACHPGQRAARPGPATVGSLAGLIRAADTGDGLPDATVVVRRPGELAPLEEHPTGSGAYMIAGLPPGPYRVLVFLDQRTIGDRTVDIVAGRVTGFDLAVDPRPAMVDSDAPAPPTPPLWRFRPPGADPTVGAIEGTISEQADGTRLEGAVVTVIAPDGKLVAEAVTDESGRYRIEAIAPGDYVVSAYYTVLGRGQFEIRRNDVHLDGGDVVVVPLALETTGA